MNKQNEIWRLLSDWRLLLYNVAIVIGSPYFLLRKLRRQITRNKTKEFRMFNWSFPVRHQTRQEGGVSEPHVIFVSGGLGEMHTTQQLDFALKQIYPNIRTTWAVRDPAMVLVAREKNPQQAITGMPYDFFIPVWRWLRQLDPDVVVIVEKLLVPNLIWLSHHWGARVLAVCGKVGVVRSSGFFGEGWQMIHRWTLRGFSIICFQSSSEMDAAKPLLSPDVATRVTGQIRLSQSPRQNENDDSDSLSHWLATRHPTPLLVAGSTKNIEEETFIIKAFEIVRAQVPCALVIAPRRLHRVREVLALLAELGIERVSRRSEDLNDLSLDSSAGAEVYILDTLGELSRTYGLAQAAFVGGTIHGPGHNVIEPLEWGVPVSFGPGAAGLDKPTVEQQVCIEAGVGFRVRNAQELATCWLRILQEDGWREELRKRAQRILEDQRQTLAANVVVIGDVLNNLRSH